MNSFKPMLLTSLKSYDRAQFAKDVTAGIIVAIIALPLSIALALASGVGPEAGIFTAIVAGFVISALGGSCVQIAGPTAAFATIVAGIVARDGLEGLMTATILAGVFLIIMGFCHFGSLIKFIPYTITTGFTSGIAVTIVIGQLKDFCGITYPDGVKPIETMEKLKAFAENFSTISPDPLIVGSICVTGLAILMGVPVAILTSVFLSRYCPKKFYGICKSGINLMAGIPSIVYGFFGLVVIVPLMAQLTGKNGNTMLTASILLAVMILPTVVGVTESAITSVPESYYEASLGLGATHSQSVFFAVVPAAKSGILAGIVLGIGRAIGETMAVIMIAGNQPRMPKGITEGLRTMTANIVLEMGYASGLHREALIATGVVLFVFILLINLSVSMLNRRVHYGD